MSQLWLQLTTQLEETLRSHDERHQRASQRSWQLNAALVRVEMAHQMAIDGGEGADSDLLNEQEEALDELVKDTVLCPDMYNNVVHECSGSAAKAGGDVKVHQRAPMRGNMIARMEDYARYKAFRHFLSEERLLSPDDPCFLATDKDGAARNVLTDEAWLAGAIGLCHDLAKRAVSRASNAVDDDDVVPFIKRSRDAVSSILEELLQFDFRNGPLRRKYDSTKYALKTLETVLYELSVAGAVGGHQSLVAGGVDQADDALSAAPSKRTRTDQPASDGEEGVEDAAREAGHTGIPSREIAAIRERMDRRDKLRESLIKTCRDGQKAAKQSIFAMHRGDAQRAARLLKQCEDCVRDDLMPILEEEPTLRSGSYAQVLEEYIEGRLFYIWLWGEEGDNIGANGSTGRAMGRVPLPTEMPLRISTDDYLGGLCDLTGEIGRYAVARGTARDKESVKLCLDSNKAIYMTLKMLGKLPKGATKKIGTVGKSVEKLERVLYEQSLMEMTGRKEFSSGVAETEGYDRRGDEHD